MKPPPAATLPRFWRKLAARRDTRAHGAPPLLSQMQWDALAALRRGGLFVQLGNRHWRALTGCGTIQPLTMTFLADRGLADLSPTIDGGRIATLAPAGRRALDKRVVARAAGRLPTTTQKDQP